jgi:hypothetical protein
VTGELPLFPIGAKVRLRGCAFGNPGVDRVQYCTNRIDAHRDRCNSKPCLTCRSLTSGKGRLPALSPLVIGQQLSGHTNFTANSAAVGFSAYPLLQRASAC